MQIWPWLCLALLAHRASAQTLSSDTGVAPSINAKTLQDVRKLTSQAEKMTADIQQQSNQLLTNLQKKELSLQKEIQSKDSAAASTTNAALQQYTAWKNKINAVNTTLTPLKAYVPRLDSLQTALRFLTAGPSAGNLSITQLNNLQTLSTKLNALSGKLQQASEIGSFLSQRQAALQQELSRFGMTGKLLNFKKQVYYYKAQAAQYKTLLNNPSQLSGRVLGLVQNQPSFQKFFQQNSYLSSLFRMPGGSAAAAGKPVPGLQTRASTDKLLQSKLGKTANISTALSSSGNNADNPLGGSMQQAQSQLDTWKQKIIGAGGGSSAAQMPDFSPNPQHNKTFLQRIQLGFDMQTQSSSYYVPAISTIALSAGYKLNSRSLVGIGAGYIVGWGQPFDHIALSSQGASLRSFLNWKIKGSYWLSGGMEMNYLNAFTSLSHLRSFQAWQSSALIGFMKQYKAGSRNGNIQLLYDALYREHSPQTQPLIFRVGYSLN